MKSRYQETGRTERPPRGARAGFTLLEIMISIVVFVAAAGAAVAAMVSAMNLSRINRETKIALEAAHSAVERIQGEEFSEAFARFNANPADDPPLATGASPGSGFAVPGLNVRPGDPDGLAGRIILPGDGTVLREDFVDRDLGMPRDLSNDGVIDAADHAAGYVLLPVRVLIEWTGVAGNRTIVVMTTIANT